MSKRIGMLKCSAILLVLSISGAFASAAEDKATHYAATCSIFNGKLKRVWRFPGHLCLFLPNGRFFGQKLSGFGLYDQDMLPLWERKSHVHHMINLAAGGKSVLAIESHILNLEGEKVRSDKIVKLSLEGALQGEFIINGKNGVPLGVPWDFTWCPGCVEGVKREVTHVNSVHEIPENSSSLSAFHRGNVIFNETNSKAVYVLSADLKKLLWKLPYEELGYIAVHDVSVRKNGNLLLFVNRTKERMSRSSVQEFDPVKKKAVWIYDGLKPEDHFYSDIQGSVQETEDGLIFFSYRKNGKTEARLIERKGAVKERLSFATFFPNSVQHVYRQDLSAFLKRNKAL